MLHDPITFVFTFTLATIALSLVIYSIIGTIRDFKGKLHD